MFGLGMMVQLLLAHSSVNVVHRKLLPSTLPDVDDSPTAMQNVLALQDRPVRLMLVAPAGDGRVPVLQAVPFQVAERAGKPTARHEVALVHETALNPDDVG